MTRIIEIQLYAPVLWVTCGALIGLPWGWFAAWITDPSHIWMRIAGTLVMLDIEIREIKKLTKEFA